MAITANSGLGPGVATVESGSNNGHDHPTDSPSLITNCSQAAASSAKPLADQAPDAILVAPKLNDTSINKRKRGCSSLPSSKQSDPLNPPPPKRVKPDSTLASQSLSGMLLPTPSQQPGSTTVNFHQAIKNVLSSRNPHGVMIVSHGNSQFNKDAIDRWNIAHADNRIEILQQDPSTSYPNKHDNQFFYTLKMGNTTVVLSEVVMPSTATVAIESALNTELSDAFMAHMQASLTHFKAQKGNSELTTKELNDKLVTIVGAQWMDSLPTPVGPEFPLDCAFAATRNLLPQLGIINTDINALGPADYAKHLHTGNRSLHVGLFSEEVLGIIAAGNNATVNKDVFIASLDKGDKDADETRLRYTLETLNAGDTKTANELWDMLVARNNSDAVNRNEITSLELTPEKWYQSIGAMPPVYLTELLNTKADESSPFTFTHLDIDPKGKPQTPTFEQRLLADFMENQAAGHENKDSTPKHSPALIAIQKNNTEGVNGHFVCLFFQNMRWYVLDSNKTHAELACKQNELDAYLIEKAMSNVVYPKPKTIR